MQQQQPQPPQPKSTSTSSSADASSRLAVFLAECLSVGCLKGFRHFELYLRGREELLLKVHNRPPAAITLPTSKPHTQSLALVPEPTTGGGGSGSGSGGASAPASGMSRTPSSRDLARSLSSASLLNRTRQRIMWQSSENLPPASPCDRELEKDPSKTVFLIAGYARYKCPFVWLRTNHSLFTRTSKDSSDDSSSHNDDPIKLDSVARWKTDDVSVIDIIVEIVTLVHQSVKYHHRHLTTDEYSNVLAVDHSFFDTLPIQESIVCASAVLHVLRNVYLSKAPYATKVFGDIERLTLRFFNESMTLAHGNSIDDGT